MVIVPAGMIAAIKTHLRRIWPALRGTQLTNHLEPDNLCPKAVGFLEIPDIQHQVIKATRYDRTFGCVVDITDHAVYPAIVRVVLVFSRDT